MIKLTGFSKTYDGKVIVKDINLLVSAGQCTTIVGPNGSGKSTILKAILGIIEPSKGSINTAPGFQPGFTIGEHLLYESLSIESNIKIFCALSGIKHSLRKETCRKWLQYFGLYECRKKKVKKISSGMKKRLTLAVANLKEPDTLVLDEPFNGLDKEYREKLNALLREKVSNNGAVILTTHNVIPLLSVATDWLQLKNGELIPLEEPENYEYSEPEN